MPTIFLHTIEGMTKEQKKNMAKRVTEVIVKDANVSEEKVRIVLAERSSENMCIGGKFLAESDKKPLYPMAFVNIKAGRTEEVLKGLKQHLSEAISETCNIPIEEVSVYFFEHKI